MTELFGKLGEVGDCVVGQVGGRSGDRHTPTNELPAPLQLNLYNEELSITDLSKENAMNRGPNFIERQVFEEILSEIPRKDGEEYQDLETPYGDMSRLVVAWLASTPPKELAELYNKLGWKGSVGARSFHEAAKR
ncbi:MAG TPA: hypothetical protein VEL76_06095, partial [Gemmataceae bacterium]|nr:hypothetical protein [Gemmataceae bacterium]